MRRARHFAAILLLAIALALFLMAKPGHADPSGASISGASTDTGPTTSPGSRADARGTITTMVLSSVQQDQRWKAYRGNVTGSLSLDNTDGFTIYDWALSTITGEVYASRNDSLDWTSVSCASHSLVVSESSFFGMAVSDNDRINATFNYTTHKQFQVGSTTLNQNTCNSTATYVNDARQTLTTASPFQEVLITDASALSLVLMTSIDDDTTGFDANLTDFQMIVPEKTSGGATTYYFYVELG